MTECSIKYKQTCVECGVCNTVKNAKEKQMELSMELMNIVIPKFDFDKLSTLCYTLNEGAGDNIYTIESVLESYRLIEFLRTEQDIEKYIL